MMNLYDTTTFECSKLITRHYSTSFTIGIRTLHKRFHPPIYAIYGFVRYADEIVDTFHDHDKRKLLSSFRDDTHRAIAEGISLNPVLHAFQRVVHQYGIESALIDAFLHSMEMDLDLIDCTPETYAEYIYGSAEVVGLMCLRVFCEGDGAYYDRLRDAACSLGAAFQKVNFLRDIRSDYYDRGRVYFPGTDFNCFDAEAKALIEADIERDFKKAYQGMLELPLGARLGVFVAYVYYTKLFQKIRKLPATRILQERVRVPDNQKLALLVSSYVRHQLNYL